MNRQSYLEKHKEITKHYLDEIHIKLKNNDVEAAMFLVGECKNKIANIYYLYKDTEGW